MYCQNCGAKNENSKFCSECGALLEENRTVFKAEEQKKTKTKGVVLGLVIVLLLLAIGAAVFFFAKKKNNAEEMRPAPGEQAEETISKDTEEIKNTEQEDSITDIEENVTETENSMAQELLGVWDCIEQENNGVYMARLDEFYFFPNGNVICDALGGYSDYSVNGNEITISCIQDEKGVDLKITYVIEDITDTEKESYKEGGDSREFFEEYYKPFYEKYPNDKLTLHITGTYQESPVSTLKVDTTFVYEKSYKEASLDWFDYFLLGNWKDNYENSWNFSMNNDDKIEFQMTDENGTVYKGDYISGSYKTPETYLEIGFNFEDSDMYIHDEVTEWSENKLVLGSGDESFVLTRTDEGGMKPFSESLH